MYTRQIIQFSPYLLFNLYMVRYSSFIMFLLYSYFCISSMYGFYLLNFNDISSDNSRVRLFQSTSKIQAKTLIFFHKTYIDLYNKFETEKMKKFIEENDLKVLNFISLRMKENSSKQKPSVSPEELSEFLEKLNKVSQNSDNVEIVAEFVNELENLKKE
jgi:hypothetical protein